MNCSQNDHLSNTPLHVASENGNDKIVSLLITRGAHIDSINSKGDSPLHIATWNGQTPCVSHLLEAGANYELLNQSGKTPLFIAVEERFPDCVELLIAHGANEFCVDSVSQDFPSLRMMLLSYFLVRSLYRTTNPRLPRM